MAQEKPTRAAQVTMELKVDGKTFAIVPGALRAFSSGKLGYGIYGKVTMPDGTPLQLSCNLVIPHSETK